MPPCLNAFDDSTDDDVFITKHNDEKKFSLASRRQYNFSVESLSKSLTATSSAKSSVSSSSTTQFGLLNVETTDDSLENCLVAKVYTESNKTPLSLKTLQHVSPSIFLTPPTSTYSSIDFFESNQFSPVLQTSINQENLSPDLLMNSLTNLAVNKKRQKYTSRKRHFESITNENYNLLQIQPSICNNDKNEMNCNKSNSITSIKVDSRRVPPMKIKLSNALNLKKLKTSPITKYFSPVLKKEENQKNFKELNDNDESTLQSLATPSMKEHVLSVVIPKHLPLHKEKVLPILLATKELKIKESKAKKSKLHKNLQNSRKLNKGRRHSVPVAQEVAELSLASTSKNQSLKLKSHDKLNKRSSMLEELKTDVKNLVKANENIKQIVSKSSTLSSQNEKSLNQNDTNSTIYKTSLNLISNWCPIGEGFYQDIQCANGAAPVRRLCFSEIHHSSEQYEIIRVRDCVKICSSESLENIGKVLYLFYDEATSKY